MKRSASYMECDCNGDLLFIILIYKSYSKYKKKMQQLYKNKHTENLNYLLNDNR